MNTTLYFVVTCHLSHIGAYSVMSNYSFVQENSDIKKSVQLS